MQLAKSLNVPELPKELDKRTRRVFRKLFENLKTQHRQIRNDINIAAIDLDLSYIINVKNPPYNAKGDGVTDDSIAIQAALDSLSLTGGKIFFPYRTFLIATGLTIPVGVHIVFEGSGSNTIIYYTGTGNAITATGTGANRAFGTYRDFKILGNANMAIGLSITYGTRRTSVENVCVETFNGSRIKLNWSFGSILQHCCVKNGTGNGIFITGDPINAATVICCNCENITGYGLLAEEVNIQIIGGLYENNSIREIYLRYCYGFSIIGAYFEELAAYHDVDAIYIADVDGTTSKGGIIQGCDFERNLIIEGTGYPINIANGHGISIEGNHIRPHRDVADMADRAHINIGANCSNIRIGANSFRGLGFTNVCKIADVANGATAIDIWNNIATLDNTSTPSVSEGNLYVTSGTTTVTDFDNGTMYKPITILAEHSKTIDVDAGNIFLNGAVDFDMVDGDTLTLILKSDNKWYEISRSDNT